ncbi:MAG: DegV family protein [Eubacteriales bacterium]|jgi:DegV family protein with EDD domain|nr:DegV family protein [Eubacteriales bacterium]
MPDHKIVLSADTPCDIGDELRQRYHVSLHPLHIILDDKQYTDGVDITSEALYEAWWKRKLLPRTAAINPDEYQRNFASFLDQGYEVIHISLGSGLSSSNPNAQIAADALKSQGNVYVIDSCSLSTGFGLLVCEAGERIKAGMSAKQVVKEVTALTPDTRASFILDTLEFMRAGGRCSSIAQIGAALMNLKPTIIVRNDRQGSMVVGKKYMGKLAPSLMKYVDDQLKNRTDLVLDRVFVTHSGMDDPAIIDKVVARIRELQPFKEIFVTQASCTISAHSGPNTLGVLFLTKPGSVAAN